MRDQRGTSVRSARQLTAGQSLDIEFADGRVGAQVTGSTKADERGRPAAPARRGETERPKAKDRSPSGQGSLF